MDGPLQTVHKSITRLGKFWQRWPRLLCFYGGFKTRSIKTSVWNAQFLCHSRRQHVGGCVVIRDPEGPTLWTPGWIQEKSIFWLEKDENVLLRRRHTQISGLLLKRVEMFYFLLSLIEQVQYNHLLYLFPIISQVLWYRGISVFV